MLVPIETLIPDPSNARKHSKKNLAAIKGSLARFGQQKPIVISKDKIVIAGNGTLSAAKELGWTEIEVVESKLTGSEITAFAIADNRTGELAEWDLDVLPGALKALGEEFDLGEIGFDSNDLAKLIKDVKEGATADDEIPENVEHRAKLGDLWILGEHRLICGDSSDLLVLERLMQGEKADLVFTDPPYGAVGKHKDEVNTGLKYEESFRDVNNRAYKTINKRTDLFNFDPALFLNSLPLVFEKNKMNAYIFCDKTLLPKYLNFAIESDYQYNILIWKKIGSHGTGSLPLRGTFRPDVEYIVAMRRSGIWNNAVPGVNYSKVIEAKRETKVSYEDHPTMKPVEIIVNECLISSNRKGIVVDFFLGSGSTMIACEKIERRCFGVEISPKYCDVILARWEKFTGKQATLASVSDSA